MSRVDQEFESAVALLSEAGEIGALDNEIADALVRVHLYRCAQYVRQQKWSEATREADLAQQKLTPLRAAGQDVPEVKKLAGLCHVARAIVAFKQERYSDAVTSFTAAEEETEHLVRKQNLFGRPGETFLEQLLQAMMESKQENEKQISPLFSRDLYFLLSIAFLHQLHEQLDHRPGGLWQTLAENVEKKLEASLEAFQDFDEGRTMLGLVYYYLGTNESKRTKGIELLRMVQGMVGSNFVRTTLAEYNTRKRQYENARKAYFDLLEKYLQFSSVPREERKAMRDQVIDYMETTGELALYIGDRKLDIEPEREHEPTIQEYRQHADLLRQKLQELIELDQGRAVTPKVNELVAALNKHNDTLQQVIKEIVSTEHALLREAQNLL